MKQDRWSREECETLYKMKERGSTFSDIGKVLKRSYDVCQKKYFYTNWEVFLNNKKTNGYCYREWTNEDMDTLYELRNKTDLSYPKIAQKLKRSVGSVTNKFRHTNWPEYYKSRKKKSEKAKIIAKDIVNDAYEDQLVKAAIELSRHNIKRLEDLTKAQFLRRTTLPSKTLPITFTELKKRATYQLEQIGFSYDASKTFGKGTYIIVGDCHGKHTRTGMFKLLSNLSKHIKADAIIHVGHFIDDDNDDNYNWKKFDNLCIVSKEEELKFLAKKNLPHTIVRKEVILGNELTIQNQDLITDYVQTPISQSITPEYFKTSTICNCHRHEFDTRCTEEGEFSLVASPGCMCEQHIVYTIKQQDFTDGRTVKQTFPSGYKKYRRMKHMYQTWQQGIVIVHVDKDKDSHVHMCRVRMTNKGFATSYFDKIITETKILNPDEKTFINSDLHADYHDPNILDIQNQLVKAYKPDNYVNLGDMNENKSINHHVFKQNGSMGVNKSLLKESATTNFLLTKMTSWAKKNYLLKGNHERFYKDFTSKLPQFNELLNFKFINGLNSLDLELIEFKQMLKLGNANYVHGDLFLYGQKGGNKLDKLLRTYGRNTIMGHCHYPSCRGDCYTVGLTGLLDLDYNEINASKWIHSAAYANSFEDTVFISNICIINNKCVVNEKTYVTKHPEQWEIPEFKAQIHFNFE